jgi:hypothetical protein
VAGTAALGSHEKKTHETLEYIRELECINNIDLSWLNDVVIDCILSGGLIKPKIEYDNCMPKMIGVTLYHTAMSGRK